MAEFLSFSDRTWIWAGALFFTCGFVYGLSSLLRGNRPSQPVLLAIVFAGFLLQTTGLYIRGLEIGSCPLGNAFEITQFTVWSILLLYMTVGTVFRMSLLGFFSSGLAAVLAILSLSLPDWDLGRREFVFGPNPWIELHAALAIFSYGIFAILAVTCAMYLLQNNSLKRKKMKGLSPFLPSIFQLDQMILRLLLAGMTVLTVSLLLGSFYWVQNLDSVNWPKLTVTIGIWIAYLLVTGLRWRRKVVAHTLAWTCILLFLITLASIMPVAGSGFQVSAAPAQIHP